MTVSGRQLVFMFLVDQCREAENELSHTQVCLDSDLGSFRHEPL
jgi:hypothetical protein